MAVSYEIDRLRSLVRIEYVGPFVPEDAFRVVDELMEDPDLRRGMNVLSDHSRGTTSTTPEIVSMVLNRFENLVERLGRPLRCALVTPRATQLGMGNLTSVYAQLRPGIQIRPFRSREEAEAWLTEDSDDRG